MIDSIRCYLWLARHGCNLSDINLVGCASVTGQFYWEFPFDFRFAKIEFHYDIFIPDLLKAAWKRKDWVVAKKYSSFSRTTIVTDEMLWDIPF